MAVRRKTQLLNLVNRTTRELNCTWDGIPYKIRPGYVAIDKDGTVVDVQIDAKGQIQKGVRIVPAKATRDRRGNIIAFLPDLEAEKEALPFFEQFEYAVARAACLQNKRNQTENPHDPREFESLCGVLEWENEIEHCEQFEDGEALDRSQMASDLQHTRKIGINMRSKTAKGRRRFKIEAYGGGSGNPTGMHVPNHPGR